MEEVIVTQCFLCVRQFTISIIIIMIIIILILLLHDVFSDLQPVGSDKVLKTTPRGKETLPSEKHNQQTGNVTKKMANDDSKTWFITFVLIFFFFLLVWFICFRKRTR